jgi:hypothetical protein
MSTPEAAHPAAATLPHETRLGDFSTNKRLLLITPMAVVVVTYPDELLEEAVDKMVRHDIGRLPVVERSAQTRLLGYLGRSGIAAGWRFLFEEEQVQDTGWLSRPL